MKNKLRDQSGISLVEVAIATGLLAITVTMVLQMVNQALAEATRGRNLMTRDRIVTTLVNYAGMPAAIRASANADSAVEPFNEILKNCAFDTRPVDCQTNNGGAGYLGFRLYLPTVENGSPNASGNYSTLTSGAITGTPQFPMRYSQFGDMCDTAVSSCPPEDWPIEAFTEFLPYCPENIHMAWRKIQGRTWNGPVYPDPVNFPGYPNALEPFTNCNGAKNSKIRLTVRPSSDATLGSKMNFSPFVTVVYVDMRLVSNARN